MAAAVERSASALRAFRQIVHELRKSDKSFGRASPQFEFLMRQMRGHQLTQRVFSKAPNEVEHVAGLYATYLSSTRRLQELHHTYRGGERSIEQSANIVGLKLPVEYKHKL